MTKKTDQANMELSSWYEKRRDELLGLLKESTAIKIPIKYATELGEASRKCQEDSFEIALVGEFQGGKSTTFNALCDGRDISPRGLGGGGIKTSAAVISAQNISNDEKKELPDGKVLKEWAEIIFKSDAAIVLSVAKILRTVISSDEKLFVEFRKTHKEIKNVDELKRRISIDEGWQELFNLKKKDHRTILQKAIRLLWKKWQEDPSKISQDDLDQLRIATLQLRFYGTKEYQQLLSQKLLPINQFQKLIAFPKDWNQRWTKGIESKFIKIEEIAFVFIHSVLVRLHSKNLQRLGCRITDCPGLFANAFDTAIAIRTIRNADAIWYLIDGSKQIGQKDLQIIKFISTMGELGKIEATCNLKGSHEQKIAEILPATQDILRAAGHNLEVYPYNARLAFLGMQGDLLLYKPELFSDLDYRNMIIDSKNQGDNPDKKKMWVKMVSRLGVMTEIEPIEEIKDLDDYAVKLVHKHSFFDNILTSLENEIIPGKARSILVDKGSERVAKALIEYEGTLKSVEDAAKAKVDEWKNMVDQARKQLEDFIKKSKAIIEKSEIGTDFKREQLANLIADNIIKQTIDEKFVNQLVHDIATILINIEKSFFLSETKLKEEINSQLSPKISTNYREALNRGFTEWLKGEDLQSFGCLQNILKHIHDDIQREWNDKNFNVNSIFIGISLPEISDSDLLNICNNITADIIENNAINKIAEEMRPGIGSAIISIIMWPFSKLYQYIFKNKSELAKEQEIEDLVKVILPEIQTMVKERDFLDTQAKPLVLQLLGESELGEIGVLNTIVENLEHQLEEIRNTFEKRVSENEDNFKKSSEERNRIAKENNKLRTETIEPLRKRIESFKNEVIKELGEFA